MNQGQLPPEAVNLLKQAAQTPITPTDPLARVKAIEQAIKRIKRLFPNLFKERQ
jgi:hypothetical protein